MDAYFVEDRNLNSSRRSTSLKPERLLLFLFLLSLSLLNPWVRGDGVGYYAYARAPLIQHNMDFTPDYQSANPSFRENRLDEYGNPKEFFRTSTGHLENHFTVGPAILWSPFLLIAHVGVLFARALGATVSADGFSLPYRMAMALGTACYGFLGLLLSFRLARKYVAESFAFVGTIGIWWASSLPVYMYFNPAWSHAHSAFTVAWFLWYWDSTQGARSLKQWALLGVIAGLMLNVYYANLMIFGVLAVEAIAQYLAVFRTGIRQQGGASQLLLKHLCFGSVVTLCLLPTFISRQVVYGSVLATGYIPLRDWFWRSPVFLQVLFSSNHGLLVWTPIVVLSVAGLLLFSRRFPPIGGAFLAGASAFYIFISCYPDWAGISSYGNRFFVSLTALFILGLSTMLERIAAIFRNRVQALVAAGVLVGLFIIWNLGFIFQWGSHLVPARGPISWNDMIYNQFHVVPRQLSTELQAYLFKRRALMQQLEREDVEELKRQSHP
jgi:hypothetical protein